MYHKSLTPAVLDQGDVMGAVDAAHGAYSDHVEADTNLEGKLTTASLPKAPDPSPFTLGPLRKGA